MVSQIKVSLPKTCPKQSGTLAAIHEKNPPTIQVNENLVSDETTAVNEFKHFFSNVAYVIRLSSSHNCHTKVESSTVIGSEIGQ